MVAGKSRGFQLELELDATRARGQRGGSLGANAKAGVGCWVTGGCLLKLGEPGLSGKKVGGFLAGRLMMLRKVCSNTLDR